jgi:hypothetical protein
VTESHFESTSRPFGMFVMLCDSTAVNPPFVSLAALIPLDYHTNHRMMVMRILPKRVSHSGVVTYF